MNPNMRHILFAWVLGFAGVVTASAGGQSAPAPAIDFDRMGPKIGETAPAFSLADQNARTRTLASVLGPKGALLVFFRSANW